MASSNQHIMAGMYKKIKAGYYVVLHAGLYKAVSAVRARRRGHEPIPTYVHVV